MDLAALARKHKSSLSTTSQPKTTTQTESTSKYNLESLSKKHTPPSSDSVMSAITGGMTADQTKVDDLTQQLDRARVQFQARSNLITPVTSYDTAMRNRITSLETQLAQAQRAQKASAYADIFSDPQFSAYEAAGAALAQQNPETPETGRFDRLLFMLGLQDDKARSGNADALGQSLNADNYLLSNLTADEERTYYALRGRDHANGTQQAQAFLQDIMPALKSRRTSEITSDVVEDMQSAGGATLANVGSVLLAPIAGIGAIDNIGRQIVGAEVSPDNASNIFSQIQSAVRGETSRQIDETVENDVAADALNLLYSTGMSVADFMLINGLTAGVGGAGTAAAKAMSLGMMGTGAATSTMLDAYERGATDAQALTLGGLAGIAEAAFEFMPLENWWKAATGASKRTLVKNALRQAGLEASSEGLTELTNLIADAAVMQDKSAYNLDVQNGLSQGLTEKEARSAATGNMVKRLALSLLGGGLAGLGTGTVASALNYVSQSSQTAQDAPKTDDTQVQGNIPASNVNTELQAIEPQSADVQATEPQVMQSPTQQDADGMGTAAPEVASGEALRQLGITADSDELELMDARSSDPKSPFREFNDLRNALSGISSRRGIGGVATGFKTLSQYFDAVSKTPQARQWLRREVERPVMDAVADYSEFVNNQIKRIQQIFTESGLDATLNSNDSKLVYQYASRSRKVMPTEESRTGGSKLTTALYTESDLQQDAPEKWQAIAEAAGKLREMFDETRAQAMDAYALIWPDIMGKIDAQVQDAAALVAEAQASVNDAQYDVDKLRKDIAALEQKQKTSRTDTKVYANRANQIQRKRTALVKAERRLSNAKNALTQYTTQEEELLQRVNSGELWEGKTVGYIPNYMPRTSAPPSLIKDIWGAVKSGKASAVKDVLFPSNEIDPRLQGISEATQPLGKYLAFSRHRTGTMDYNEDAIASTIQYIMDVGYATHINPQIARLRKLTGDIAKETVQTRQANGLIQYLMDFTNDLAGKTSRYLDRLLVDSGKDRGFVNGLKRVNAQFGRSRIMGNLSSALSQFAGAPQVVGVIRSPIDLANGANMLMRYRASLLSPKGKSEMDPELAEAIDAMQQSGFLLQRYGIDGLKRTFDEKSLRGDIEYRASKLLEFGDKLITEWAWLSAWQQANNPQTAKYDTYDAAGESTRRTALQSRIAYADDMARRAVGGRGIGEVAPIQKSMVARFIAPFTLEVNNAKETVKGLVRDKDWQGFIGLAIASWLVNSLRGLIDGREIGYDPLGAAQRSITASVEEGDNLGQAALDFGLTQAGEYLSSGMFGSLAAQVAFRNERDRQMLFGDSDPTRYGTGLGMLTTLSDPVVALVNAANADNQEYANAQLQDALVSAATGFMPFGAQVVRTGEAVRDLTRGYNAFTGKEGEQATYAMSREPLEVLRALAFGSSSTAAGQEYYESGASPLSASMTQRMLIAGERGITPAQFMQINNGLKTVNGTDKDKDGKTDAGSIKAAKVKYLRDLGYSQSEAEYMLSQLFDDYKFE